jgi:hypothetical protein
VGSIYTKRVRDGNWRVTRYLAEIAVEEVEKGDGIAKGSLAYVRYWRREWAGPGMMPPSTSGHRGIPDEGARIRAYLARNADDGFGSVATDGGLDVLGANGFETLPPK